MSTKTTFKRVALVAVAALGLGVLSVAPSQADAVSVSLTPSATASAITTSETATITIAASAVAGASTDSLTVRASVTSANVATAGTLGFVGTTDSTTTRIYAPVASPASITMDSTTVAAGQLIRGSVKLNLVTPSKAGTYTVLVYTTSGGTSGATKSAADKEFTWTVTVTAPSTSADSSSTAFIAAGSSSAHSADSAVTAAKSASGIVATIKVNQKNATSSANEDLVVTLVGPGFISDNTADSTTAGSKVRSLTVSAPGASATSYIKVFADGTTGVGTVTITAATSGTVIGTKSVTFSDTKPATIAAVVKKAYIAAGASTKKVFAVTVKDAAGNAITGTAATVTGTRTDTTTAGKALASADLTFTWDATDKVYYAEAAGASSVKFGPAEYKITATGTDADATAVSTTATTTFADTVATSVTITAPATANVGDKITYTLTAKEKNGYPIADQTYEGGTANGSTGGIFWNTTTVPSYSSAVKPFNAGETITTVSGVATVDVYVPSVAGTITNTWTLAGTAAAGVTTGAIDKTLSGSTVVTSTVVTNPGVDAATDAANEATDAANAATDAALAAADAADAATAAAQDASDAVAALSATVAKLVASLKAQITSLTNLVIKIQKKVRA